MCSCTPMCLCMCTHTHVWKSRLHQALAIIVNVFDPHLVILSCVHSYLTLALPLLRYNGIVHLLCLVLLSALFHTPSVSARVCVCKRRYATYEFVVGQSFRIIVSALFFKKFATRSHDARYIFHPVPTDYWVQITSRIPPFFW